MNERMHFQDCSPDELCECVGVTLTVKQDELIERRPDWRSKVVVGAMKAGQDRYVDADCVKCNSFGLKISPSK